VAPNALARIAVVSLVLGLAACGGKKESEEDTAVNIAAIRARRDSIRRVAVRDSLDRARFATCSDSVLAALEKAAKGKKKKPAAPAVAGMIPPEVLAACGKPPTPLATPPVEATTGKADSAAHLVTAKADSAAKAVAGKADTGTKVAKATADTAKPVAKVAAKDTAKGAAPPAKLTAKQLQVLRADSIRQARERARQDSLRQVAERAQQDSIVKAQRDSVRAESLKVARETEVLRETFTYAGGSRDPFASLITEDRVGPEFNDLLLVGVYLDLRRASNSVAVLRDKTNQKRYKLRVGDRLGRLKVAQIRQTDVVFTVEDIGFERQETLSLRKREEQTP
jgi:hypothetical protein